MGSMKPQWITNKKLLMYCAQHQGCTLRVISDHSGYTIIIGLKKWNSLSDNWLFQVCIFDFAFLLFLSRGLIYCTITFASWNIPWPNRGLTYLWVWIYKNETFTLVRNLIVNAEKEKWECLCRHIKVFVMENILQLLETDRVWTSHIFLTQKIASFFLAKRGRRRTAWSLNEAKKNARHNCFGKAVNFWTAKKVQNL